MSKRSKAEAELWKMIRWIVAIGIATAIGAIAYLAVTGELHFHMVVATLLGVFLSVLLGCGLFALAFFSDKSGHDQSVTHASRTPSGDDAPQR